MAAVETIDILVLENLLEERQFKAVKSILDTMNPVDSAELISDIEDEHQMVILFRLLPKDKAAEVFSYIDPDLQEILIEAMSDSQLQQIMSEMFVDDAVDVIEEMPSDLVERLLRATDAQKRSSINALLKYPEDSAGSIMTTEFISLMEDSTVAESLKKIKRVGIRKETIYTCYVLDGSTLVGIVSAKDLMLSEPDEVVSDIMDTNILSVNTHTDKEEVASLFSKYDLITLPVVDNSSSLVGIVTFDDAIDVLSDEAEEDFAKMAAMTPTDKPYLRLSVFEIFKNRMPWLLFLLISATFTSLIITKFENALSAVTALTIFIPMIMATGGNSGSQSSVTVIRALSLGEITTGDFLRVVWKEIRVSVYCGLALAVCSFAKVILIDGMLLGSSGVNSTVALVVALTLFFTVICAKIIGACLPILAEKLKLDPAVMASPIITTIMDCVSLLLYFAFATALMSL